MRTKAEQVEVAITAAQLAFAELTSDPLNNVSSAEQGQLALAEAHLADAVRVLRRMKEMWPAAYGDR